MTFRASPHSRIDKKYAALLEHLKSFQKATISWMAMSKGREKDAEAARLKKYYATFSHAPPLAKPDNISEKEIDLAFASGVLRAQELEGTVIDQAGIIDTFSSATLSHFAVDFCDKKGNRERVRDSLLKTLNIDESELIELEQEFYDSEILATEKRKRVIGALDSIFDLHGPAPRVGELFAALYTDFYLPEIDVKIIRTATSIFFCVPFESVSHLSVKEGKQSDDSLSRLWGNFSSQKQSFMAHFPVFGFFTGDQINAETLKKISKISGLSLEESSSTLTSMISILPAEDVDKYIIHDVWGHQWQAHLFDFEKTYTHAAGFQKRPDISKSINGESIETLLQYAVEKGTTEEWEARCIDYLVSEYEERLIHSISALFAEVLADAMEYKFLFLRKDLQSEMPSSSFLSEFPAKLDLTLHDLPIYFRLALRGISSLKKTTNKRKMIDAFIATRPDSNPIDVSNSVDEFAKIAQQIIKSEENFDFQPYDADQITMNAHAQLAFQFFELVEAHNQTFSSEEMRTTTSDVFVRHFDLLIFSTAAFYERSREEHFWGIDTFVRRHFPSRYKKLQTELNKKVMV